MRCLVLHSGMQYSHQLAFALEEGGHLTGFWSGIPTRAPTDRGPIVGALRRRARVVPIPGEKRRSFPLFPAVRHVAGRVLGAPAASAAAHRVDHAFDRWVAWQFDGRSLDAVICYENSALRTFQRAKRHGLICILDAASVHHAAARLWGHRDPEWVDRHKEAELQLADAVITCSPFAAQTYRDAGIPGDRIYSVPLGAEPSRVARILVPGKGRLRCVFVGSVIKRKGVDWLLEAFQEFGAAGEAELTIIGGPADRELVGRAAAAPGVTYIPFLAQDQLFQTLAEQDVLILPSRFDSFGMVVPEAMALGLPALVTDRVGAKCVIEARAGSGWIVQPTVAALRAQLRTLVRDPERVRASSQSAQQAASEFTWARYRARIRTVIEEVFARHRAR